MKLITPELVRSFFPKRPQDANKGSFGRVLVVAGSQMMTGAGVLCAKSALKAGAGLVVLALPKSCQQTAACQVPEMLTLPLAETPDGVIAEEAIPALQQFIESYQMDLLVIGPGLGDAPFVVPFLKSCPLPAVVDADALNQIAKQNALGELFPREAPTVCTPHPGEMKRLIHEEISADPAVRARQAEMLSRVVEGICVLKGNGTVVAYGNDALQNTTGGPELAKAGTGDILCGMAAGFWAQLGKTGAFDNRTALEAAVCAVYLHGLCGDLAAQKLTDTCVLAGELLQYLPAAIQKTLLTD